MRACVTLRVFMTKSGTPAGIMHLHVEKRDATANRGAPPFTSFLRLYLHAGNTRGIKSISTSLHSHPRNKNAPKIRRRDK